MLSVVIPTYNRFNVLAQTLSALGDCVDPPDGFEVIVVSDGSTDGTNEWLASARFNFSFKAAVQTNAGPASARNRAVAMSQGERILFLGDDIVPEADLLMRHVARARREMDSRRVAVLGHTTWHPYMRTTPFLRHINENGPQFGYSHIPDPNDVHFTHFYTSNVSISRGLWDSVGGFDITFPSAAWEDIEFAYRARTRGLRIVYESSARGLHLHPTSVRSVLRRQQAVGQAAAILLSKHPELASIVCGEIKRREDWAITNRQRLISLCVLQFSNYVPWLFVPSLCDRLMRATYLNSLSDALDASRAQLTDPVGVRRSK